MRERVEREVVEHVNAAQLRFSSPRGVGDAVQEILGAGFRTILGELASEYSDAFARRAMADLAFFDRDRVYHAVDVKTHFEGGKFSMPNLVSVERLARFYEDDANSFDILLIRYRDVEHRVHAYAATFIPIEWLDWSCLTLGALGWGQLQIADARTVAVNEQTRARWMCQLCDEVLDFYPREIAKITERIGHFEKIAAGWRVRRGQEA